LPISQARRAQCGASMSADSQTYSRTFPSGSFFILVEEFTAAGNLAVSPVLDFDPAIAIDTIPTVLRLGDDTFKVLGAGKFKEAFAFALEMFHIKKMGRTLRNDAPQCPLAPSERFVSKIASVEPQEIKGAEARDAPSKEQPVELRTAFGVETRYLAV